MIGRGDSSLDRAVASKPDGKWFTSHKLYLEVSLDKFLKRFIKNPFESPYLPLPQQH